MSEAHALRRNHAPHLLVFGLLAALTLALGACNTVEGAGQDIEAAGESMSDTAEDVRE